MDTEPIAKLYANLSYFDEYGGSVFLFVLINILAIYLHFYVYILSNAQAIKDDWPNNKCKAQYIPFAGLIADTGTLTAAQYTEKNFAECNQNILTSMTGTFFAPLTGALGAVGGIITKLLENAGVAKGALNKLQRTSRGILPKIQEQLSIFITPIKIIFLGIKDMMLKMRGVLVTLIYFIFSGILTGKALFGAIMQLCIIAAIALFAILVVMLVNPFTAIIGVSLIVPFTIMEALLVTFIIFTNSLGVQATLSKPKFKFPKPAKICFHPQTIIRLHDGSACEIQHAPLGAILENGSKINAVMHIHNDDSDESPLYWLHNILVTGSHYVQKEEKFIHVADHPEAIAQSKIKSDFYICLITSDHKIKIGDLIFWDWEDDLLDLANN